ncbi:MAG: GTPase HflX, partial [Eubacteriales bacterium]|nr:GTPase HflX [Eubacteriales bacterium]
TQMRNLEKAFGCEIMDRTALILEIFLRRARTREAKLQVEAARLQYALPRLTGSSSYLGRQSGGVGTWNKGLGEQKLELDRRRIEARIAELNKKLSTIGKEKDTQRKKRNKAGIPIVALAGYTNAGKSTLMNAISALAGKSDEKKVYADNLLFATLETSVRSIPLPDGKSFLLSDTVGFINKLPHSLVEAFRSTLKEVADADLLLHVADISDPDYENQIKVTSDTLNSIGAGDIPVIQIFNKADLAGIKYPYVKGDSIFMSAAENAGICELLEMINKRLSGRLKKCRMLIPYDRSAVAAYLQSAAEIFDMEYKPEGIAMMLNCSPGDRGKYKEFIVNKES